MGDRAYIGWVVGESLPASHLDDSSGHSNVVLISFGDLGLHACLMTGSLSVPVD